MALQTQGVSIRRMSTTVGSTGVFSTNTILWDSTLKQIKTSGVDSFVVAGFTSGMRIVSNSSNNSKIYTAAAVAATAITLYEPCVAQSSGITMTITGNKYEEIGSISGFNGPSGAANVIDITSITSTAKEKLVGLRDEGKLTLDLYLDTTSTALHRALKDDRANRTNRMFDIEFSNNSTAAGTQPLGINFDAYVTNFSITGSVDNAIKASITLEISSAIKWIEQVL